VLYFALAAGGTVGGFAVANEDVIAWNDSGFSLVFDGSDVGVGGLVVDALARIGADQLLLSFSAAGTVPGVAGTVDDSDVVLFEAQSLGQTTAGSFSMYFDGSDAGLSTSAENIDGIDVLANGNLVISTTGNATVPGASAGDEDILQFAPSSLGATTAGTWSMYFDGSDVGLSSTGEDVDGASVSTDGTVYLTTNGAFSVPGVSGQNEDVFVFTPTSLGATTSGSYSPTLFFDGSVFGLGSNDVNAIDVP
jgi:hypothetical protein